jgi:hypothetical protein
MMITRKPGKRVGILTSNYSQPAFKQGGVVQAPLDLAKKALQPKSKFLR